MPRERREIWYEGQVQGVGFRFTSVSIARHYPIAGYVENLPDGRVHLVCEGTKQDLDAFVDSLGQRMEGFIRQRQQDSRPATGEFHRFEIRH